jgi:phospholipase C
MVAADRRTALDHVVVVMFENRSFDNLLGRLSPVRWPPSRAWPARS